MTGKGPGSLCPSCGGGMKSGTTTFTAELGFGFVGIRHVPATVCAQCGADWIADDVTAKIETLIDDARRKRSGMASERVLRGRAATGPCRA